MSVAVGIGLSELPFRDPEQFWRWVDLCEDSPLDSIWQTDRVVSPLPMLECMSMLAALSGRTKRLKFGMNVISLAFRDPVLVAKQCATIDFLSDGRLLPAFGIGNPRAPEWQTYNLATKGRGRKTDEGLEIISRLWREDKVDFDGQYFQLTGASIWPKPVQKNIPIWIGGNSRAAIRRTARIGTGWQAGLQTPEEVAPVITAIKEALQEFGRTIDHDHYGAGFPYYFGSPDAEAPQAAFKRHALRADTDPQSYHCVGDADDIVERLAAYIDAGVSKFILRPLGKDDTEVHAQTEMLIEQVLPVVAARWPKH